MFSLLFFDWTHIPKTQVKSDTVWNEHGAWKKNGAGDQKNSKGRVPKQAQGNPILNYWQLPLTNKHKSLPNQDAQNEEQWEFGKILLRQVDLFTREMRIKCARFIHEQSCRKSRAASGKDTRNVQTRDRQKTNYFQDNIALWKTLQDGISEQGFFLFVQ